MKKPRTQIKLTVNDLIDELQRQINDLHNNHDELQESFESSEINLQDQFDDFNNEIEDFCVDIKDGCEKSFYVLNQRIKKLQIEVNELTEDINVFGGGQTKKIESKESYYDVAKANTEKMSKKDKVDKIREQHQYKYNNDGLENLPKGAKYLGHPGERNIPESTAKTWVGDNSLRGKARQEAKRMRDKKVCKVGPLKKPTPKSKPLNVNALLNDIGHMCNHYNYEDLSEEDIAQMREIVTQYEKENSPIGKKQ